MFCTIERVDLGFDIGHKAYIGHKGLMPYVNTKQNAVSGPMQIFFLDRYISWDSRRLGSKRWGAGEGSTTHSPALTETLSRRCEAM